MGFFCLWQLCLKPNRFKRLAEITFEQCAFRHQVNLQSLWEYLLLDLKCQEQALAPSSPCCATVCPGWPGGQSEWHSRPASHIDTGPCWMLVSAGRRNSVFDSSLFSLSGFPMSLHDGGDVGSPEPAQNSSRKNPQSIDLCGEKNGKCAQVTTCCHRNLKENTSFVLVSSWEDNGLGSPGHAFKYMPYYCVIVFDFFFFKV